jgi:hypothetical protein
MLYNQKGRKALTVLISLLFISSFQLLLFSCTIRKQDFTGFQPEDYLGKSKEYILKELTKWPVKVISPYKKGNKKKWHWIMDIDIEKQKIDVSKHTDNFGTYNIEPSFAVLTFNSQENCDTVKISFSTWNYSKENLDLAQNYYKNKMGITETGQNKIEDITPLRKIYKPGDYISAEALPRTKIKESFIFRDNTRCMLVEKESYPNYEKGYDNYHISFYNRDMMPVSEKDQVYKQDTLALYKSSISGHDTINESENFQREQNEVGLSILEIWLKETIGYNFHIKASVASASFNFLGYRQQAPSRFKKKLLNIESRSNPTIRFDKNFINIEFQNSDFIERLFALESKFIYCYDATFGSSGGTIVYDLKEKTDKEYDFKILSIQSYIAEISKDGYDDLGHYWQKGKFDISTGKFYWETLEH